MNWLVLFFSLAISIEVLLRFKIFLIFKGLIEKFNSLKSIIIDKETSDDQKQKTLINLSLEIFKNSIYLFFLLILIILPFFLFEFIGNIYNKSLIELILSYEGFFVSIIFCIIYIKLRNKIANRGL